MPRDDGVYLSPAMSSPLDLTLGPAVPLDGLYLVVDGKAWFVQPQLLSDWIQYDATKPNLRDGLVTARVLMKIDLLMAELQEGA